MQGFLQLRPGEKCALQCSRAKTLDLITGVLQVVLKLDGKKRLQWHCMAATARGFVVPAIVCEGVDHIWAPRQLKVFPHRKSGKGHARIPELLPAIGGGGLTHRWLRLQLTHRRRIMFQGAGLGSHLGCRSLARLCLPLLSAAG